MDKQLKAELRKLLTGRTIRDEEGWLIAVPDGQYLIYHGVTDRTGYRKIICREERLQLDGDGETVFYKVMHALQEMGLLVNMQTKPDALCALCRFFLTKTVVLCIVPQQDGSLVAEAYTGRSLTAALCCRMAISKLVKILNPPTEA